MAIIKRTSLTLILVTLMGGWIPGSLAEMDKASRAIKIQDRDGDGMISAREWRRSDDRFKEIDSNQDGFVTHAELSAFLNGGSRGGQPDAGGPKRDAASKAVPESNKPQ